MSTLPYMSAIYGNQSARQPQPRSPLMMSTASQELTSPLGLGVGGKKLPGAWADLALGLGIGLLTGKNPGQGVGQGLGYARNFRNERLAEQYQNHRQDQQDQQFDWQKQQQAQQTQQYQQDQESRSQWPQYVQSLNLGPETTQQLVGLGPDQGQKVLQTYLGNKLAPDKSPSAVQEYEYGQQHPDFNAWVLSQKRAGANNTKVDIHAPNAPTVGTITPDYILSPDGNGGWTEKIIPGSKTDLEQQAAKQKTADTRTTQTQAGDIVTDEITRALQTGKDATLPTAGIVGGALSNAPGFAAYDTAKLLDTVKANIGFDRLQEMRNNSPTGGALGNVSGPEMDLLQSVKGSLDQSQSPEQFNYNLKRLYNVYLDTIHGPGKGPQRYDLGSQAPGPGGAAPASNGSRRIDGYVITPVQ